MRVYGVCRNCAEVHLASAECPRCQRRLLAAGTGVGVERRAVPIRFASVPRAEPTALVAAGRRSRRWWMSAVLLGVYVAAIVGLLAAVLLAQVAYG